MRRPPLTPRIVRGLEWIESQASADLESVVSDEVPSLSNTEAGDVAVALNYIRALRRWAQPTTDGDT